MTDHEDDYFAYYQQQQSQYEYEYNQAYGYVETSPEGLFTKSLCNFMDLILQHDDHNHASRDYSYFDMARLASIFYWSKNEQESLSGD